MVTRAELLRQFHLLGVKPSMWAQGEIKELANILTPGERLRHVVFGWYENGLALLCCTDYRVILIDKKLFFLKLEDLRYDKISEVKFLNRLLDSSVVLSYAGMNLEFKSWSQKELRKLTDFVQQTITTINRQQWHTPVEEVGVRPVANTGFGLSAYPEDLVYRAANDLGLAKNPYVTNKLLRRRIPLLGFNQSSR